MCGRYNYGIWEGPIMGLVGDAWLMMRGEKSQETKDIDTMDGQESCQVTFIMNTLTVGVKELFEAAQPLPSTRKQRSELRKNVDADYYGYRDEDDGLLVEYEEAQEEVAMGHTIKDESGEAEEGWTPIGDVGDIPGQTEVEQYLVERRKRKLLERYGM
jgi:pre-mRNA-splicing factor ISY1